MFLIWWCSLCYPVSMWSYLVSMSYYSTKIIISYRKATIATLLNYNVHLWQTISPSLNLFHSFQPHLFEWGTTNSYNCLFHYLLMHDHQHQILLQLIIYKTVHLKPPLILYPISHLDLLIALWKSTCIFLPLIYISFHTYLFYITYLISYPMFQCCTRYDQENISPKF